MSSSSLRVTEEGDERGPQSVLLVVVLGATAVIQLDQAVIVRQVGVCLTETPSPKVTADNIYYGKGSIN